MFWDTAVVCCWPHLQKEKHSHDLKCGVDLANGLNLIPLIGHKICSPDTNRRCLTFCFART